MNDCIFCKIIERKVPSNIIFEDNSTIIIKDRAPKAQVHYLIIPKKHVQDIQSLSNNDHNIGSIIFSEAQKLSKSTPGAEHFKLVINNGYNAGQRVFHLHAHFLAGHISGEV